MRPSRRSLLALTAVCAVVVIAAPAAVRAQPAAYRCPVTFYLQDDRPMPVGIAALVFDVAYVPPALRFKGIGTSVACTRIVANTLAVFDDDDHGVLRIDLSTTAAMSSLFEPLAWCTTESAELPTAADFAVTIIEETKVGGGAVEPPVAVRLLLPDVEDCLAVDSTTTSTTSTTTTTTIPPVGPECGDPTADSAITATDALFALNAAVGLTACATCLCDVDGSTAVTASDALILLSLAVGQPYDLACAPC